MNNLGIVRSRAAKAARSEVITAKASDPRWQCLDLICATREQLGLRSRDITVLRGLLSLLPSQQWQGEMVVFAGNAALISRCDGMDERTLRRALAALSAAGLIRRHSSPNGKRYRLRDHDGETLLAYGISLAPLPALLPHLTALHETAKREALRQKALRSAIRQRLFHMTTNSAELDAQLLETARLSLRRKLDSEALESLLQQLQMPAVLTGSDSQNDRHIQSSNKETLILNEPQPCKSKPMTDDLTLGECLELVPDACGFAAVRPESWEDLGQLGDQLAPAIGIDAAGMQLAKSRLGWHATTLAVLGLVQAFGRIRKPAAYLARLVQRAADEPLDALRMFRSLTRTPSVAAF